MSDPRLIDGFYFKESEVTESEKCFILRRRSGKTQKECADEAGISRYWFNMMEQGKVPNGTLVNYWRKNAG